MGEIMDNQVYQLGENFRKKSLIRWFQDILAFLPQKQKEVVFVNNLQNQKTND